MSAGRPINIKSDSEMMVPPPARVLMNPTNTPETIRAMISRLDMAGNWMGKGMEA